MSVEALQRVTQAMEAARQGAPVTNASLGLSAKEIGKYSVMRAFDDFYRKNNERAFVNFQEVNAPASLERELTEECWKRMGRPGRAFADTVIVPYEVLRQQRDVSIAASGGGYLVESKIPTLADFPRPRGIVRRAGATFLTGIAANISIPRENATATVKWLTNETDSASESTQTVLTIALGPKTVSVYEERSRLLGLVAPELSELLIRRDLERLADSALDAAAIAGTGTAQPMGIVNAPGISTFTGASVAWADVLNAQSDVLNVNMLASPPNFAYVTTPSVAELLAKRQGFSTAAPMWTGPLDEGTLAGARAFSSTNVPAATIIAGDWSQLFVAEYGPGVEIRINPVANFAAGIVGYCLFYTVDTALTSPTAFSVATSVS